MPRELLNANITHVSYVDKGANQKKFFLTKSEEQPTFEKQVKVLTKADDAEKLVYGVVYEPDVIDAHGDYMTASEIEKAAHQFLKDARNVDTQHNFESGAGEVVESYVAPADIEIGGETITKGTWVLVTKATDEIWESIQKGEITGYSMAGTAETVEKTEQKETSQMKAFFQTMKAFFLSDSIEKGEVKDAFFNGKTKREFFDALYIFEDYFYDAIWSGEFDKVADHARDLADLLNELANSPNLTKALGDIEKSKEVIRVKKEDFQALLKEELAPLTAKVAELEKAQEKEETVVKAEGTEETEPAAEGTVEKAEDNKEELIKSFQEVLKAELAPLTDRIEAVEKARGISKAQEKEVIEKSESTSVWAGLL